MLAPVDKAPLQPASLKLRRFPLTVMDLEQYRIQSDLEAAYYIPEFITEAEEEYILRKVNY